MGRSSKVTSAFPRFTSCILLYHFSSNQTLPSSLNLALCSFRFSLPFCFPLLVAVFLFLYRHTSTPSCSPLLLFSRCGCTFVYALFLLPLGYPFF